MQKTFNQSAYFFIKHVQHHHTHICHFRFIHSPPKATYISKKELNYNNINQQIYHESLYLFFNE